MQSNWKKWEANAARLRAALKEKQPPILIKEVMAVLGYDSKSSAEFALMKMQELGEVKWIDGRWYFV